MTLGQYLRREGVTYHAFAARLGKDKAQVHRWASGKRHPSLAIALKIVELTGGAVQPHDFLKPRSSSTDAPSPPDREAA